MIPHSDWISVFSPNAGKYGPEKTPYLDSFHAVLLFNYCEVYVRGAYKADTSTLLILGRDSHFLRQKKYSKYSLARIFVQDSMAGLNCYFAENRSSRLQMFYKTSVLKHFPKFTGKHLCWSILFIKNRLKILLEADSNTGLSSKFYENFVKSLLQDTSLRMPL